MKPVQIKRKRTRNILIGLLLTAAGCSTSANMYSVDDDKTLGKRISQQIAEDPSTYPVLNEAQYPEAYQHIRRITSTILNSGQVKMKDKFEWKVQIIRDDKTLNAFCTPGGYIYVYTGIIKYLESEDQLAGVMGHEIGHADNRHSTKQMTKAQSANILITLASIFIGRDISGIANPLASLTLLKYGRDDETEADASSVKYLYPTDYDARGAARFFEKMVKSGQSSNGPVFLSTHPDPGNRVQAITKEWQKMGGKEGQTFADRYNQIKKSIP
ncbi:MAG: M48 family metalloprotease [Bacteroidetes bacterium]|nr:M48 family metalloprotease [Bacteroidota bacterium]